MQTKYIDAILALKSQRIKSKDILCKSGIPSPYFIRDVIPNAVGNILDSQLKTLPSLKF
jgi:hypothetical protein